MKKSIEQQEQKILKSKKLKKLHKKLINTFLKLEKSFYNDEGQSTTPYHALMHLYENQINSLLNGLKSLEYEYRDHVPETSDKKNQPKILKKTNKILKKYTQLSDPNNLYSKLILNEKHNDYTKYRKLFHSNLTDYECR